MTGKEVREFLLPSEAERDEGFRSEIERLGRRGLRIIGWIEIVMPILSSLAYHTMFQIRFNPDSSLHTYVVGWILLGIATRWSADTSLGSRYSREVATLSGLLSVGFGIANSTYMVSHGLIPRVNASMSILIVLLVGLALLPLKPWHALALGGGSAAVFLSMASYAIARGVLAPANLSTDEMVGLPLVILLCTALVAANYKRLAASWRSNQLALQAAEELRQSETRTVVAESAASMGRLAAAVSHELNSPLGAMRSAADTLPATAKRLAATSTDDRERLLELVETLSNTIVQSSERMQEILTRMQRFTNLDGAEVQNVDMNRLLDDVAALVTAETGEQTTIDTSLGQLPNIPCRPQQLSVVFASLLRAAVNRAGAGGRVRIAAGSTEPHLEISVNDSGPPLSSAEAARLLGPEFRVSGSRVTTGDWNLFTARRIVREAGGDIRTATRMSGWNTFVVSLPYPAEAL